MVGDTRRADGGGLVPRHQEPDSLLCTETGVEDNGAGLRGAALGVSSGWRCPRRPCRPSWLWGLRWLAHYFSPVHSSKSPGWQSSSRHRASSVENRTALALFVFSTDRFAIVIPIRSASSVSVRRRSSKRWSSLTRMAISPQIVNDWSL